MLRSLVGSEMCIRDRLMPQDLEGMLAELAPRREALMKKEADRCLGLVDISNHQHFVTKLQSKMSDAKDQVIRKYRITEALLLRVNEPRKVNALAAKMQSLRRWEQAYNVNVNRVNEEVLWFQTSPAFHAAQAHVLENWQRTPSGALVNKQDLEADSQVTFEELLEQMKHDAEKSEGRSCPDPALSSANSSSAAGECSSLR
eukprot:TRINITY_DN8489_c0_g1_i1.p1 TRINITY_DN8489_c0_g1~~TRINITY_DN8489_c0_g1_i1.p1  ORF type:complete len:224 (+),score=66.31 TRINITY_DN8489_c0_g1_i1:70-672(+)